MKLTRWGGNPLSQNWWGMDKRKFVASFSVKVDTRRIAFEVSPAPLYDGPDGFFRVRAARLWIDTPDNQPRYFDKAGLARLVVDMAFGGLPGPQEQPSIPYPSRVSVRFWRNGMPYYIGSWTNTAPILDYTGEWVVNVSIDGKRVFVPVRSVVVHGGKSRG